MVSWGFVNVQIESKSLPGGVWSVVQACWGLLYTHGEWSGRNRHKRKCFKCLVKHVFADTSIITINLSHCFPVIQKHPNFRVSKVEHLYESKLNREKNPTPI